MQSAEINVVNPDAEPRTSLKTGSCIPAMKVEGNSAPWWPSDSNAATKE